MVWMLAQSVPISLNLRIMLLYRVVGNFFNVNTSDILVYTFIG